MGWVVGCVVLLLLAAGGAAAWYVVTTRQIRAWEERVARDGERLLCWVASADPALYEVHDVPGFADARVVFSPDDHPDLERRLKEAARRLSKGDLADPDADEDRVLRFYDELKEQRWLHPPIKLPRALVGDFDARTAMVQVYWRRLPRVRLTGKSLYCHVLLGEGGGVVMADDQCPGAGGDESPRRERARRTRASGFPVLPVAVLAVAVVAGVAAAVVVAPLVRRAAPEAVAPPPADPPARPVVVRPPDPPAAPVAPPYSWPGGPPVVRPELPSVGKTTAALGGAFANIGYSDYRQDGSVLVGFEVGLGRVFDTDIVSFLRPHWRTPTGEQPGTAYGKNLRGTTLVKARDGYALAGVAVAGGGALEGIAFTFMRQKGSLLDPADAYTSDWYGEPRRRPSAADMRVGDGSPAVGFHGLRFADRNGVNFDDGGAICTIGLVIVPAVPAGVPAAKRP